MSARLLTDDVLFYQRLLQVCGLYHDRLDGIWGPNTDQADNDFTEKGEALKAEYGAFDARTEKNIATLHLEAQRLARIFMSAAADFDVTVKIISGTRSYAEQDALFAKGRTAPGDIVTNAKGGQSNHNFGIAWDIGLFKDGAYLAGGNDDEISLYAKVSSLRPDGVEWGGNWTTFKDPPHYQVETGLTVSKVRERFEKGHSYT